MLARGRVSRLGWTWFVVLNGDCDVVWREVAVVGIWILVA